MKLTPLQTIALLVILAGVVYGTYSATVDQLPDLTGTVMGNTTNNANITNDTIGNIYITDEKNESNTLIIVKNSTQIFKQTKDDQLVKAGIEQLKNGSKVEVYTIGKATNPLPPQIVAEKIVVKKATK